MKNKLLSVLSLLMITGLALAAAPHRAHAGVSLPWSTTYNCSDWNRYGDPLNCDGLNKDGAWTCSPQEYYEQITSAANNPAGGGGSGQRHWIGDSLNNVSGGTRLAFADQPGELWFRWTMRFQKGFTWAGDGFKVLYFYDSANSGFMYLMIHNNPRVWTLYTQLGDRKHYFTSGGGWEDLFPAGSSDGTWHEFQIHLKRETTSASSDGVWEMWVDGVKKADERTINYGMAGRNATIDHLEVASNSGAGANGGCAYVDFDDIAVSMTGPVAPLTRAAAVPNPPSNLR